MKNSTNENQAAPIGRLWQSADSQKQAGEWAIGYMQRGAHSVKLKDCDTATGQTAVIVALRRDGTENTVMGYSIGPEEWLEPLARAQIFELCKKINVAAHCEVASNDGTLYGLLEDLLPYIEDMAILAQE
jgi:hypothetical protein